MLQSVFFALSEPWSFRCCSACSWQLNRMHDCELTSSDCVLLTAMGREHQCTVLHSCHQLNIGTVAAGSCLLLRSVGYACFITLYSANC